MFIRIKKSKNGNSSAVQIVENQRVGATTKQTVIRHVGTGRTPEETEQLLRLAKVILKQIENKNIAKQSKKIKPQFAARSGKLKEGNNQLCVDISQLKEKSRYIYGIHDVYGHIYDQLGFTNLFTRPHQRTEAAKILRDVVLARIACPVSKRASVKLLQEKFGINIKLNHVYQMMDKIDDAFCERIQQRALDETLKLTGEKLQILFYDATTLYFESFIEDDLKQYGYSKDMKFNQSQVLLALFVTSKGLPVGYELFPGSTFEGNTLIPVLEKLKERYRLEEVVFVADRGLLSEENLKFLEAKKFKYIVGSRIKNASKKLKEEILNLSNYKTQSATGDEEQKIATFAYKSGRQLIVSHCSKRARKEEYDRRKSIEKLYKKMAKSKNPKSLLNNYGYKKYIEVRGNAYIELNHSKIEMASQWDGLLGIVTNIEDVDPQQLLSHYRGLWQIEESFRINKHDLKMRPIYHWKASRVRAHIAISFIAFVCVRYLEYIMTVKSKKISPELIRNSLQTVQASIVKDSKSGRTFLLPSPISPTARSLYHAAGIKIPQVATEILRGAL